MYTLALRIPDECLLFIVNYAMFSHFYLSLFSITITEYIYTSTCLYTFFSSGEKWKSQQDLLPTYAQPKSRSWSVGMQAKARRPLAVRPWVFHAPSDIRSRLKVASVSATSSISSWVQLSDGRWWNYLTIYSLLSITDVFMSFQAYNSI